MADRIEQIERYLQNQMQAAERQHFEEQVELDPSLREDISRMKLIDRALEHAAEKELRTHLRQLANAKSTGISQDRTSMRTLYTRIAAAAAMLLIFGISLWLVFRDSHSDLENFTASMYIQYDYNRVRGVENGSPTFPFEMADMMQRPKQGISQLRAWMLDHPKDDEARFILADLLKRDKQPEAAKQELAVIITHNSVLWSEKAAWNYILISAVDTWDGIAESQFQKMKHTPSHSYHQQVLALDKLRNK